MRRPQVLYISYDGACEPLGRSQVVAYLVRLATKCDISLISFEKDPADLAETAQLLKDAGVEWIPLSYHKRPPVLSTIRDVLTGARQVRRVIRRRSIDIVHVRSYVPALIALSAASSRRRAWRFLFDVRGFWPEERVEGGIWGQNGLLFRLAKRCERWFFGQADSVVTLTVASVPTIRRHLGGCEVPIEVIPTCAEVDRFQGSQRRPTGPHLVWCGSVGTFYRFDLAVRLAALLGIPFTVLTREVDLARAQLADQPADVRSVAPSAIPQELHPGDIGLCLYVAGQSNLARAPTRFAEYLAAGMVVASSPGIGDLEEIITKDRLGAIVVDETSQSLAVTAEALMAACRDQASSERARTRASELYSIDRGVTKYLALYDRLLSGAQSAPAVAGHPGGAADHRVAHDWAVL